MNKLEIPSLDIPSIENMLTLKIMSVDDIIRLNEKTFEQRLYNQQFDTSVIAGYWDKPAVWIGSNPHYY